MTHYVMVMQSEAKTYHQDMGTSEVEAYARTEAYIHHLRRECYTVVQWAGAPVWDCARNGERFTLGLYEKCDIGEDGGGTDPFGGKLDDSLALPFDKPGWFCLN